MTWGELKIDSVKGCSAFTVEGWWGSPGPARTLDG